jgi:NAD(P)-dependent dehydrogenase (short-subunit alcohol dehydrogenase family)
MQLGLTDKCALVTGSSRGTGAAIVRALAREGAFVIVHGPAESDAQRVLDEVREAGGRGSPTWGDLTTDAGAEQVASLAHEHAAGVDILVNNFGRADLGSWQNTESQDWIQTYQVNTLSAARMIRHFSPGMKERGWGRIVQIATIGSTRPNAGMPHYYAAKAALANMTVSLAKDLAGSGVTVNTVSPGLIHTPEVEQYFRYLAQKRGWGDDWANIEREGVRELMKNPLGRMARMEEVAAAVAFLASEQAAYINGTNLRIDGGATDTVN